MSDELDRAGDAPPDAVAEHTPEEQVAFEERVRSIAVHAEFARIRALAELEELDEAEREAEAAGDHVAAGGIREQRDEMKRGHLFSVAVLAFLLVVALIVILAVWALSLIHISEPTRPY